MRNLRKGVIVAGGTGGHVYPALEVARKFRKNDYLIHWVGGDNSLERKICLEEKIKFEAIKTMGFRNKNFLDKIFSIGLLIVSFIHCLFFLKRIRPEFIFCCGGYITLGPGLASFILRIPLFIHEQNSIPGTANKILARLANGIFEGFQSSFAEKFEAQFVGNPVRPEIELADSMISHKKSLKEKEKENFCLLVLGGSQGSSQLNSIIIEALVEIKEIKNCKIIHQSGSQDLERLRKFYSLLNTDHKVASFIKDIGKAYLEADLVISRAGAMTVSELIVMQKPSILLPLPWATDNHQQSNAEYLKNIGACEVIISQKENVPELEKVLRELIVDNKRRLSMSNAAKLAHLPNTTEKIFTTVNESIKKIS